MFAAVFIEQIGVPLPAAPWLFAAGALVGAGKMNGMVALGAAAFGSLLADVIWFYLGRHYGNRLLGLLCRISLAPDSCVRRTQDIFTRYGMRGIVGAKFIPGLSTLAPPLAGSSGIGLRASSFSMEWVRCSMWDVFCWWEFCSAINWNRSWPPLASLGNSALAVVAGLAAAYIGYKYWQRRRLLRDCGWRELRWTNCIRSWRRVKTR